MHLVVGVSEQPRVALRDRSYVWIPEGLSAEEAFSFASELVASSPDAHGPPEIIGDFVLPPRDGAATRDFQTLHFDFGLPLRPTTAHDIARFTALYVANHLEVEVTAATVLVPLGALLAQRPWPARDELIGRLATYGRTHGAWDDELGYTEGSLARLIEAASGEAPALPNVKADPEFLCGLEFRSLDGELAFFSRHGLDVGEVAIEIPLQPGGLLLFDNLAFAHGRRGVRQPGELRQRVFGHRQLIPAGQLELREEVLSAFGG